MREEELRTSIKMVYEFRERMKMEILDTQRKESFRMNC